MPHNAAAWLEIWRRTGDPRHLHTARVCQAIAASNALYRIRAARAYFNPRFPARPCDHCGALYTGPTVYCSLICAEADT